MIIDLHCHTIKAKNNEADTRNVSKTLFSKKVKEAGVEFLAITNHNMFDYNQYNSFKESVKDFCYVIPGVELDVKGEKNKSSGHVIVLFDPNKSKEFNNKIESLLDNKIPDDVIINVSRLIDCFKNDDVVYIAHFYKDKQLSEADLDDFESRLINKNRLLREPANLFSVGVLESHNHKAVIGSDVRNWNEYESCKFGNTKFYISNYSNFLKLIDKNDELIKNLLNDDFEENVQVFGDSKDKKFPFSIPIYDNINIIFGDKGSGKSEILKSLNEYYLNKGLNVSYFEGGDKTQWYKELIKNDESDYNSINLGIADSKDEDISNIIKFSDFIPVSLKTYYMSVLHSSKNEKKKKMKSLNIKKCFNYNEETYKSLENDCIVTDEYISKLNNFSFKLIKPKKVQEMKSILSKFRDSIYQEYKKCWKEEQAKYLLNNYIDKMNKYVSDNTGSPKNQNETGFFKFAQKRLLIKKTIDKILKIISETETTDEAEIGKIGGKGVIKLNKKLCFINPSNCKNIKADTLCKNKKQLSQICQYFLDISKSIFEPTLIDVIEKTRNVAAEIELTNINDFISSKRFTSLAGNEYEPSKGELAILSLQHDLLNKDDCDVYLLDEVETNLSSIYINDTIIPLLLKHAKAKKKLIIATHDANIAIRTRPSCSIMKITDNNKYFTYVGNMFQGTLKELSSGKELSWKEESIKYLEGGKEAFEERGDLYD